MRKETVANICNKIKIHKLMFRVLKYLTKNNYIRVINYHEIYNGEKKQFEEHLKYYQKYFVNCNYEQFQNYLENKFAYKNKPGMMITFDDGLEGNYTNAAVLLEKYGFTGYFMVPVGMVNKTGYMTRSQLLDLVNRGHVIGCHTLTHHRMSLNDSQEVLRQEIREAKKSLESMIKRNVDIFCWCYGDAGSYTSKAYRMIVESGYKYAFMTDSYPVFSNCNPMHIQRTNIQSYWNMNLVRFQLCGFMDIRYRKKRKQDESITS